MELIIYNDGMYYLIEVTKQMTASLKIFNQIKKERSKNKIKKVIFKEIIINIPTPAKI